MASHAGVPVIACGKSFETGESIKRLIEPDIQVIHFFSSVEDAYADLGHLIAGRGPQSSAPNHIGTNDYGKPPIAVMFGRAFPAEDVVGLNKLYRGKGRPVAWIAADPSGPAPPANPGADYAKKAAENVKGALARWEEAGANSEDIVYY